MRNLHAFEKYKSTLQKILLIVVSCTCLPSPLPPGNVREEEVSCLFCNYGMAKSGTQKTKVSCSDHTAELKLTPPAPPAPPPLGWRGSTGVLGKSSLADCPRSHLLQPGSLDKDRFTGCSFRGEISPWATGA